MRPKWLGALASIPYYAHSQSFGYAYVSAVSAVFFLIVLSSLWHFEITRIRKTWLHPAWIVVPVGLSSVLVFLIGYHVYVPHTFE